MVKIDETTQGVLNQISDGFAQKGAYNLRQNGIALCHGDSEHIKIRKKKTNLELIFSLMAKLRVKKYLFRLLSVFLV